MKKQLLIFTTVLLATMAVHAASYKSDSAAGAAAFARLKTLVGEWEADTKMGKAHLGYELIADGTALVERETVATMPPMLTVYYLDGDRLLLTHYCMRGNQPRMQARAFNPESGELEFQFLDATNLAAGASHMHSARLRVAGQSHLATDWEFYENGQRKFTETVQYTRVR